MSNSSKYSNVSIEEIITIRRSDADKSNNVIITDKSTTTTTNNVPETDSDSMEPDAFLCVLWNRNTLGGAYYKTTDKQVL